MMIAMNIQFLKSAKELEDCPEENRPEVALMGRSNAGKSSFLNALTDQNIAKVSQVPGKTRLLNFFDVGEKYRLVDMPGYGYASRGGDERVSWGQMVENFVRGRDNLVGALLIMDIRRDWSDDEKVIAQWVFDRHLPISVVLNKGDKCSRSELSKRQAYFSKTLKDIPYFVVSATKKTGIKSVEAAMFKNWINL